MQKLNPTGRKADLLGYGNIAGKAVKAVKKYARRREKKEKKRREMAKREEEERNERAKEQEREWMKNEDERLWELLGWRERHKEVRRVTEACLLAGQCDWLNTGVVR